MIEDPPTRREIQRISDDVIPHLIESTVREHLVQKHGLDPSVVEKPDYDIDVCLPFHDEHNGILKTR